MAEHLLAFGIAANIIQFIDFSSKLFSTAYQIHESRNTITHKNQELETITNDLRKITGDLDGTLNKDHTGQHLSLSPNDLQLQQLATQCRSVCVELSEAVEKLKIHGKSSGWTTLRVALKSVWSERSIEDLQRRIEHFRQELILGNCHADACSDHASESHISQSPRSNRIEGHTLDEHGLGEIFLDYIKQANSGRRTAVKKIGNGNQISLMLYTKRHEDLKNKLLKSLHFSEMRHRHDKISETYEKTFQWIYGEPRPGEKSWTHFVQWLEGDGNLYWVTGKAGSGKSTLMKYIFNDARTIKHLETWTSGKRLVVAAFFFWNSGSDIEMSRDGLLRSLLFQILVKTPDLIPRLLPQRWEVLNLFSHDDSSWSSQELRSAFKILTDREVHDSKYCLFIDGLDEFDGDHSNLTSFVKDISLSDHFKICVSSRPLIVFEDALNHQPNLMLQHLTYPDIKYFVESTFANHSGFAELEMREPQYASALLEAIAQKALGVFLWVHLVVESLLAGLLNSDRVSDLQRRLDSLPPDLEKLYEKILESLEPFYFQHAAQFFQIVQNAKQPPTLLCLSFADEEPQYVHRCKIQPLNDDAKALRADVMRRRLTSRCKGLLEVGTSYLSYDDIFFETKWFTSSAPMKNTDRIAPSSSADLTVQYLHRTVKDYLESPKVWNRILAATHNE
ncbi:MAG: hypothetical protein Q9195_009016 [Heterodermia aff. obscurata]